MITLSIEGDRMVFAAPSIMKDRVRQIPGVRWNRQHGDWRAPLSWATALAARAVLGADLELAPSAVEWGLTERLRVAQSTLIDSEGLAAAVPEHRAIIEGWRDA